MPLFTRHSPIGLDIGARCVHAAQLRRSRSGPVSSAWTTLPRPVPGASMTPEEARRIAGTLDRLGFAGRTVVLSIPEDRTIAASLELPPRSSSAPLEAIARQELARAARCEPAELEMAWWELPGAGRAGEPTHALAVGCRHAESEPFVAALDDAGLDVASIDAPLTALARAAAPSAGPPPQLTAVLDLGWHAGRLLLLHGALPVYQRSALELGLSRLCDELSRRPAAAIEPEQAELIVRRVGCAAAAQSDEALPQDADARARCVSLADEAAEQVRLAFAYAQRRFDAQPAGVLLAGGGAAVPGMPERIAHRLEVPARELRAEHMARHDAGAAERLGTIGAQALALAASGPGWTLQGVPDAARGVAA